MKLEDWKALGTTVEVGGDEVFVVDTPASEGAEHPPLVVIHGFPTSSVDHAPVLGTLSRHRRVVLFDLPGFGLSTKPDRPYGIGGSADAAAALLEVLELGEFDLLTHDMGDTVGGELLARDLEGTLPGGGRTRVRRRVVTNGSIYLDMAQLTPGQQVLWSAPDEMLPEELAPAADALAASLADTMAGGGADVDREDLRAAADSVAHADGTRLLPRLIRYLSDRRDNEARYTGAIEAHPSALSVVWGAEDPIAVVAMAHQLAVRRPDASVEVLEGVGHYPSIEAPDTYARAVLAALDT